EITKTFVGPDSAAQFLPRDDFPWTLQQYLQQFHRLLLDSDSDSRFAHFTRLEGNLISSESHDRRVAQWFHIGLGFAWKSSTCHGAQCQSAARICAELTR